MTAAAAENGQTLTHLRDQDAKLDAISAQLAGVAQTLARMDERDKEIFRRLAACESDRHPEPCAGLRRLREDFDRHERDKAAETEERRALMRTVRAAVACAVATAALGALWLGAKALITAAN